jgi:hypothetical protein
MIRRELQNLGEHSATKELQADEMPLIPPTIPSSLVDYGADEFVEGSSSMSMDVEHPLPVLDPQGPTLAANLDGMLFLYRISLF